MLRIAFIGVLLGSMSLASFTVRSQSATTDEELIGIWAIKKAFGPALKGELIVSRRGSNWSASVSSAKTEFRSSGRIVNFSFPGGVGQFRGVLNSNDSSIEGYWLQPSGETRDRRDPGGSGQPFASPLVMRRTRRDVWRANLRPLVDTFTLYLKIFRNSDGLLTGAFRNPEQNSTGGASQYRVAREDAMVTFSAGPDPAKPVIRLTAKLRKSPDRLEIFWKDLNSTIELKRSSPTEAADFFPRPPGEPAYTYRQPPSIADGWTTARARDAGFDEADLTRLVQNIIATDPSVRRPSLIHSLLIARRGKLVLEEYFYGYDGNTPHDTRSAGKTFASIMLGAASRQGVSITPQTRVYDVLGRFAPFANPDPRKSQITLAHLMTHTSGLACDDNNDASPGREDTMQSQRLQPNWWKYTLDLPMAHDPGRRYAYCSANTNLVGGALTISTRTWLPELFDRTVARPLQFDTFYWNLMPSGEGYLGGGAFLLPRDLLKVGQAYLDGGVWNGRRIVDSSWVKESTASYVKVSPETTGLTPDEFPEYYAEGEDGYTWHPAHLRVGDHTYRAYAATGNGGQLLIVIPDFELVVVFTGGNYGQGGIWGRWLGEVVPRQIIPAIRK